MTNNSIFDWYKLHELGCKLYESGSEVELRTAINRFYYGSFCYARDYLIHNKIFVNADLKKDLCSGTGVVHGATQEIFRKEKQKINPKVGRKIHKYLYNLRKYRNKVDYDLSIDFNLEFRAKQSKIFSEKIFEKIDEL